MNSVLWIVATSAAQALAAEPAAAPRLMEPASGRGADPLDCRAARLVAVAAERVSGYKYQHE
jgi:hypothetical protein